MPTQEPVLRPGPDEPLPVLLMNTVWADRSGVHDALTTPEELRDWLGAVDARLPRGDASEPAQPAAGDLQQFRDVRAALRRLAADATGDGRERALEALDDRDAAWAVATVNAASAAAPPVRLLAWPDRSVELAVAPGNRGPRTALSTVAAAAVDMFSEPDRYPLRACLAPGCVLYFVKNHARREWCSEACGNRARARRHYDRHRGH